MVAINREWWEHLAPKRMHPRRREIERLLSRWCADGYGAHWLVSASQHHGIIRAKTGDKIPAARIIALGDDPAYMVPQQAVRPGLRTVGQHEEFQTGRPLEPDELVLKPTITFDLVEDEELLACGRRGDTRPRLGRVTKPSLVFTAPAALLLSPSVWPTRAYVLYQHIFGAGSSYPDDGYFYVGVTTRSWQQRWKEHRRAMENGSPLLFHRRMREELTAGRVTYIHHKVMGVTADLEALYASEEFLVEGHWRDTRHLNMIPGGKSGLRYMREHGMLPERVVPLPDERDALVSAWLTKHPRKGLPAPWVAEKWRDDAWAVAQICGRDGRLSVEQVQAIRVLAATHSPAHIAAHIGAASVEQVQRVLDHKTYTRVP